MHAHPFNQSFFRLAGKAALLGLILTLPLSLLPSAQASSYASSSSSATAVSYSSGDSRGSSCKCCCEGDVEVKVIKKLIKDHTVVTITLSNGVKLQGVIKADDCKVIILECGGNDQMIFKKAIIAILPVSGVMSY